LCRTPRAWPTAAEIKTAIEAGGSSLAQILEDTGTTLPATLATLATAAALATHDGKLDTVDGLVDALTDLLQKYPPDGAVIVAQAATDTARGAALLAARDAAAMLTPGGAARSATNRAAVLIPPGRYKLTTTMELDDEWLDFIATEPEMGGPRAATDLDESDGTTVLSDYRPPRTEIYCEAADTTTIEQSAADVQLKGFAIAQLSGDATGSYHAFYVSDSNLGSRYDQMYFWHRAPNPENSLRAPVAFDQHVDGTWTRCIANAYAWRVGRVAFGHTDSEFRATMIDCEAGAFSFIGDWATGDTQKATGCRLVRCKAIGKHDTDGSGYGSFAGCGIWALEIDSTCYFEDCEAGDNSFGLGSALVGACAGTFIRCRGGANCFGGTTNANYVGQFDGYAEDCYGGPGSFGGRASGIAVGSLTGTLNRCHCEGSAESWRLTGATILNSTLTVGTNNKDCVTLLDSNSRIAGSTLLVVEGGTGVPINAGSALNVCAAGNRYNNQSAAADGTGSNVTNVGHFDNLRVVLADTNELQTDWADGGRLDTLLDGASAPTVGQVADAVWDEAIADHVGAGSTGKAVNDLGTGNTYNISTKGEDIETEVD